MNCRAPWETPNRPGVKPCVEIVLDVVEVDAVGVVGWMRWGEGLVVEVEVVEVDVVGLWGEGLVVELVEMDAVGVVEKTSVLLYKSVLIYYNYINIKY